MNTAGRDPLEQVKTWLLARKPELSDIDLDLDLIDTRVLDSLAFITFIVYLEGLVGCEIDTDSLNADSFRTLRLISDNILAARASG